MPNPLPTPGADDDVWGTKLNACLETSIDGTTGNLLEAAVVDAIPTLTGDVTGTVPGPLSVAAIDGIALSGTPTSGEVLTATGGSSANWQTPAAAPLTGDVTTVSTAATLVGTSNVENIIRAQTFNQLTAPSAAMSANGQRWTNLAAPVLSTDAAQANYALLGAAYYEPSTPVNYTIASATFTAIDTTHLTVSFTAISTLVVVDLEALILNFSGSANEALSWALFTHGTTTQVGYTTIAMVTSATDTSVREKATIRVAGLTAGTAYQLDWAWASGGANVWAMSVNAATGHGPGGAGSASGPAIMRVFAG